MKIQLTITSTVLCLAAICLQQVQSANMEYRYKPRGPPRPPRQPPLPHYLKKWEQNRPSRNSIRPPRPIPLDHIQPNFLQPQFPSMLNPPIKKHPVPQIPVRNVWQNQNQIYHQQIQLPQPTPPKAKKEKPFQFSQQINNVPEYDYQIQTNTIPTHSIPIKQVGEKGPIHTIPAPNLSPADRPAIIEEQKRPAYSYSQQAQQLSTAPHSHAYQVTESNDHIKNAQKNFRDQQAYYNQQTFANAAPETVSYSTSPNDQQTDIALTQQEIYQLINAHITQKQQEPQQLYNSYDVPIIPQALVQQPHEISVADYNAMIGQAQAESQIQVLQQSNSQYQAQKAAFANNPHLQMYNYERHAGGGDQLFAFQGQDQAEPFIQEIFEQNLDVVNRVEPKSDVQDKASEGAVYFTSLPNRQAAETLASLQSAGKNNNAKVDDGNNSKTPLEIYVPDLQEFTNFEVGTSIRHKKDGANLAEFEGGEDYVDVQTAKTSDDESAEKQENQRMFGKRIQPKQKE